MDKNDNYVEPQEKEEEGLDIMAIVRGLWDGRKTIFICVGIFVALGLVAAITMKREYTVKTMMVPQIASNNKSGLGGLAALAGIDMGAGMTNGELSPLSYPQIATSVPFLLEIMHTPLHYEDCDTMISMLDYEVAGYNKPSVFSYVLKYTIGLPIVILNSFRSEPEEVVLPSGSGGPGNGSPKPIVVSNDEHKMLKNMDRVISLDVDPKEGNITLTVKGIEPIQTAELAMKAQKLLQDEVTRFRIEKSKSDLEYIQARYDEAKEEAERYQVMLASAADRSQYMATTSAGVGKARLQSKYNVANAVYLELAKQLEQAKMQVKKDTPVFAVIQPVTIPMQSSNSRVVTLFIWTFLGIVLGCGIVICRNYWPKVKAMFKPTEEAQEKSIPAES